MPLSVGPGAPPGPDPLEFTFDDALLNAWIDDSSVYLQLDADDLGPIEPAPPEQS